MPKSLAKPAPYLLPRIASVRAALDTLDLDTLLITHPGDLAWLTDFSGEDSIGVLTHDTFTLVTDFRYTAQAAIECPWLSVKLREVTMSAALADVLRDHKSRRIGFEQGFTTYGAVHALKKALRGAPKVTASSSMRQFVSRKRPANPDLIPLDGVLVGLRKVKDSREIATITDAVRVAEQAFIAIRPHMAAGITENLLAGKLNYEMRARGATDSSFPVIVAAGANAALPHYRPHNTKIKANAPLLIDWGARYNGYCSDLTRTLMLGKVPAKIKEIYQIVLDAQLAALAFLRPGVSTFDADAVARNHITAAGYGPEFGHSLGHGIGRDIHEQPSLRKSGTPEPLQPGMIVTVEPGIYLPGVGGVRIEDDVLITKTGCQILSSLPKSLKDNTL